MLRRVIDIPDDSLIKFSDLPALIAEVKHDDEMAQAITRHLLEEELVRWVIDKKLRVRDSLTHGYIDQPQDHTLQSSVVTLDDLRPFLEGRLITLKMDGQKHDDSVTDTTGAPAQDDTVAPAPVAGGENGKAAPPVNNGQDLAALFDPVSKEALEKMFPTGKNGWKNFAERADRNGLKDAARQGRARFNPLRAAEWWLESQTPPDWNLARINRVLANNLPTRSKGNERLLTGDYD